jgi:hypothetical protein
MSQKVYDALLESKLGIDSTVIAGASEYLNGNFNTERTLMPSDYQLGRKTDPKNGDYAHMIDLSMSGQFGWAANFNNWVSHQAYVDQNLICIMLRAPAFIDMFNDRLKKNWLTSIKHMFETHPTKWDGFDASIKNDFVDHAFGGMTQVQQELSNSTRAKSSPKSYYVEKRGMPMTKLLEAWSRYGGIDPTTKFSMAAVYMGGRMGNHPNKDALLAKMQLATWGTADAIFIEPDIHAQHAVKAWVVRGMFPMTPSDIKGAMDKQSARNKLELTVEWTGLDEYSGASLALADEILKNISLQGKDPFWRPSQLTGASSAVTAAGSGYGYSPK